MSELLRRARQTLERGFPLQWIVGEVSTLTRAASGHLYFTLRDESAQVRCVMYRSRAQLVPFRLAEGQRVEIRALVTLYEARGEFQLQVEQIRQAGRGNLFEAFLRLKDRLTAEGLFDAGRKRPLPELPRGIGIVTSRQAAALHDVLVALRRRAPQLPLVIYPSPVQGDAAGAQLTAAVQKAGARAAQDGIDVLIVCRGGGSLEDLWAFNDEALARAIAASPIPVVSGVGHETDFTLADFAADLRAATPTAAAEILSAGHLAARTRLAQLRPGLVRALTRRLETAWERSDRLRARLTHPRERLARQRERLEGARHRLQRAQLARQERLRARTALAARSLQAHRPRPEVARETLRGLALELSRAVAWALERRREHVASRAVHLQHLNPQAVLARGFAIVRDEQGRIVRDAGAIAPGTLLDIRPAQGRLSARVETLPQAGSNPTGTSD
ncbi:exodeoxyribonuclease VII large subunit [Niveibacterium sp. SC-1]|uniref:exodeoxyribonuclease VII large subunit n=1 Tax=Niveibacterium sp. SC-1 TaxID=3135646 RepID=UPI00311D3504